MHANDKKALPWLIVGGLVIAAMAGYLRDRQQPQAQLQAKAPESPVSMECQRSTKLAEFTGLVRPGPMDRSGAIIFVSARWTQLPASDQAELAECLSHVIAGGQDKWIKRIEFRNQAAGVTYGVIQNTQYTANP